MSCPILNIFSKCSCAREVMCLYCSQLTIAVTAMVIGGLIAWKSKEIIAMQIAFYRLLNWDIKPIDMDKEIRNTRIMGMAVLILSIAAFMYIVISSK